MGADAMSWVRACGVADVPDDEGLRVEGDPPIAIFRVDGDLVATADTCTHAEASLAEGYVEGGTVECPFHFARFCLRTGAVLSLPATKPLQTYDVKVEGEDVYVLRP